jgi:hypothetical protein
MSRRPDAIETESVVRWAPSLQARFAYAPAFVRPDLPMPREGRELGDA